MSLADDAKTKMRKVIEHVFAGFNTEERELWHHKYFHTLHNTADVVDVEFSDRVWYNIHWAQQTPEADMQDVIQYRWNNFYLDKQANNAILPQDNNYPMMQTIGTYVSVVGKNSGIKKWVPVAEIQAKGIAEAWFDADAFFLPEGEATDLQQTQDTHNPSYDDDPPF